jgi:uncharacterized protein YpmB
MKHTNKIQIIILVLTVAAFGYFTYSFNNMLNKIEEAGKKALAVQPVKIVHEVHFMDTKDKQIVNK